MVRGDSNAGHQTRLEFLGRCGVLIGANHNPAKHYVSRTVAHVGLGIDADMNGMMRVHLFSDNPIIGQWLSSIAFGPGPIPELAQAASRLGPNGARWYYGFEWRGVAGRDYALELPRVQAFVSFLRTVALDRNARF
jgi:hypothetical protein